MTHTKVLHLFLGSLCLLASQSFAALVIDEGLNNTGNTSGVASSGKAVNFVMGAGSDYTLDSIVLGFGSMDSGLEVPVVELWSDDGSGAPIGALLETLTNPGTLVNGQNTFTASGTTLSASTTYWVVVQNAGSGVGSGIDWLGSTNTGVTSDIGATHTARLFGLSSNSPGSWTGSSGVLNQIQVNATVIPEPSTLLLTALAGCAVMFVGRRRR